MSSVFQNIDLPPPSPPGECVPPPPARRVCTPPPPPLVRGEDTLAGWKGGGGSIFRKTPDTALYSTKYIRKYFVSPCVARKLQRCFWMSSLSVYVKERGARYVLIMLDEKQKKVGVIAASAGKSFRSIALVYKIKKYHHFHYMIRYTTKMLNCTDSTWLVLRSTQSSTYHRVRLCLFWDTAKWANLRISKLDWLKRNQNIYAFVPFGESSGKIHSPNLVHLQCTTRIKFFSLQILDWPVIPVSAWEQVTPFSLSLPKQNSWSAQNLLAKPDRRPRSVLVLPANYSYISPNYSY